MSGRFLLDTNTVVALFGDDSGSTPSIICYAAVGKGHVLAVSSAAGVGIERTDHVSRRTVA